MKLNAWTQMGLERRETVIEIPEDELESGKWTDQDPTHHLETWLEEYVMDWLLAQYGWGWIGAEFNNDFSFMEGAEDGGLVGLVVTSTSSIPNTVAIRLCPGCRQPVQRTDKRPSSRSLEG